MKKKVLSLALVVVMVFAMSASAFAATPATATITFQYEGEDLEYMVDLTVTSGQTLENAIIQALNGSGLASCIEWSDFYFEDENEDWIYGVSFEGFTYDGYLDLYNNYISTGNSEHGTYAGWAWEYTVNAAYGLELVNLYIVQADDDIVFDLAYSFFSW